MLPGRQERWERDPRVGMLVIVAGIIVVNGGRHEARFPPPRTRPGYG